MPRATKETKKDEIKDEKKSTKTKASAKKTAKNEKEVTVETKKKAVQKKDLATSKKSNTEKKSSSTSSRRKTTKKEEIKTVKEKSSTKKVTEKKEPKTSKTTSSKKVAKESVPKAKKTTISKKSTKKEESSDVTEINKATKSTVKNSKSATSKKAVKEIDSPKEKKASSTKKKTTTKKTTTTKKSASKTVTKKRNSTTKSKKLDTNIIAEYYDLPYRYNETIVKILYQTPSVLFVYWDISDDDRAKFVSEYGEYFFNNTKPILKIYNLTKNYNFEIEINDFANSWYINVNDANCDYKVELGRRPISYDNNINTDYIYVSSSNNIQFPNDHILLEELPKVVNFKNVKTNRITTKTISTLRIVGINKIYSVYDFYKKLYNDDILEEINNKKILCSSSSTSSWSN